MNEKLLKTMAAKSAALGFIFMILLGNYWFILNVTKSDIPNWVYNGFLIGAIWVIVSGVCLAVSALFMDFNQTED